MIVMEVFLTNYVQVNIKIIFPFLSTCWRLLLTFVDQDLEAVRRSLLMFCSSQFTIQSIQSLW